MKIIKRILHYFIGHTWKSTKKNGWDYSEPQKHQGDYLPTKWKEYICSCGLKKCIYSDGFTHFGKSEQREFLYDDGFCINHPKYK